MRAKRHKRWHLAVGWISGIGMLAAVTLLMVWLAFAHRSSVASFNRPTAPVKKTSVAPANSSLQLSSKILFGGDIFWDRKTNRTAQASPLKEAYPFSRLNEFGRQNYDAWIANLECPSVPGVNQPFNIEASSLIFNCPTSYMPEAAKWFTAFSNANNHSANQGGEKGLDATRKVLDQNGIQHFGSFDPNDLANVCDIITVPAKLQSGGKTQTTSLPIAMCGYHGLAGLPSAASLAVMKDYSKYMPTFAYPHMGVEYTPAPTSTQVNLYRQMIDNGADAVFGGHPHWVQTSEVYKNKLIIYSMGDFLFDQAPGETQRGAAFKLTLQLNQKNENQNLAKWLQLGDRCKPYHDDCLTAIKSEGLTRLPLTLRYDLVPVSATMTPAPANNSDAALISSRLGWDKTSAEINAVN